MKVSQCYALGGELMLNDIWARLVDVSWIHQLTSPFGVEYVSRTVSSLLPPVEDRDRPPHRLGFASFPPLLS